LRLRRDQLILEKRENTSLLCKQRGGILETTKHSQGEGKKVGMVEVCLNGRGKCARREKGRVIRTRPGKGRKRDGTARREEREKSIRGLGVEISGKKREDITLRISIGTKES